MEFTEQYQIEKEENAIKLFIWIFIDFKQNIEIIFLIVN